MNKIQNALNDIHATEQMKDNTAEFVWRELEKRQKPDTQSAKRFLPVLAYAAAFTLVIFGGFTLWRTPSSYISIDVNPSVELSLNLFDRVVKAEAYNDDGERVIENIRLTNKKYTDAIETLLTSDNYSEYLGDDAALTFTVISDNESIIGNIEKSTLCREINGSCVSADKHLMQQAHNAGLSFGKYRAYLELAQYDSSVTAEDCKSMTMREIRSMIDKYDNQEDTTNSGGSANGCGGQNGSGEPSQTNSNASSQSSTKQYSQPTTNQYSQPATKQYSQQATKQYSQQATKQYSQQATKQYSQPSSNEAGEQNKMQKGKN